MDGLLWLVLALLALLYAHAACAAVRAQGVGGVRVRAWACAACAAASAADTALLRATGCMLWAARAFAALLGLFTAAAARTCPQGVRCVRAMALATTPFFSSSAITVSTAGLWLWDMAHTLVRGCPALEGALRALGNSVQASDPCCWMQPASLASKDDDVGDAGQTQEDEMQRQLREEAEHRVSAFFSYGSRADATPVDTFSCQDPCVPDDTSESSSSSCSLAREAVEREAAAGYVEGFPARRASARDAPLPPPLPERQAARRRWTEWLRGYLQNLDQGLSLAERAGVFALRRDSGDIIEGVEETTGASEEVNKWTDDTASKLLHLQSFKGLDDRPLAPDVPSTVPSATSSTAPEAPFTSCGSPVALISATRPSASLPLTSTTHSALSATPLHPPARGGNTTSRPSVAEAAFAASLTSNISTGFIAAHASSSTVSPISAAIATSGSFRSSAVLTTSTSAIIASTHPSLAPSGSAAASAISAASTATSTTSSTSTRARSSSPPLLARRSNSSPMVIPPPQTGVQQPHSCDIPAVASSQRCGHLPATTAAITAAAAAAPSAAPATTLDATTPLLTSTISPHIAPTTVTAPLPAQLSSQPPCADAATWWRDLAAAAAAAAMEPVARGWPSPPLAPVATPANATIPAPSAASAPPSASTVKGDPAASPFAQPSGVWPGTYAPAWSDRSPEEVLARLRALEARLSRDRGIPWAERSGAWPHWSAWSPWPEQRSAAQRYGGERLEQINLLAQKKMPPRSSKEPYIMANSAFVYSRPFNLAQSTQTPFTPMESIQNSSPLEAPVSFQEMALKTRLQDAFTQKYDESPSEDGRYVVIQEPEHTAPLRAEQPNYIQHRESHSTRWLGKAPSGKSLRLHGECVQETDQIYYPSDHWESSSVEIKNFQEEIYQRYASLQTKISGVKTLPINNYRVESLSGKKTRDQICGVSECDFRDVDTQTNDLDYGSDPLPSVDLKLLKYPKQSHVVRGVGSEKSPFSTASPHVCTLFPPMSDRKGEDTVRAQHHSPLSVYCPLCSSAKDSAFLQTREKNSKTCPAVALALESAKRHSPAHTPSASLCALESPTASPPSSDSSPQPSAAALPSNTPARRLKHKVRERPLMAASTASGEASTPGPLSHSIWTSMGTHPRESSKTTIMECAQEHLTLLLKKDKDTEFMDKTLPSLTPGVAAIGVPPVTTVVAPPAFVRARLAAQLGALVRQLRQEVQREHAPSEPAAAPAAITSTTTPSAAAVAAAAAALSAAASATASAASAAPCAHAARSTSKRSLRPSPRVSHRSCRSISPLSFATAAAAAIVTAARSRDVVAPLAPSAPPSAVPSTVPSSVPSSVPSATPSAAPSAIASIATSTSTMQANAVGRGGAALQPPLHTAAPAARNQHSHAQAQAQAASWVESACEASGSAEAGGELCSELAGLLRRLQRTPRARSAASTASEASAASTVSGASASTDSCEVPRKVRCVRTTSGRTARRPAARVRHGGRGLRAAEALLSQLRALDSACRRCEALRTPAAATPDVPSTLPPHLHALTGDADAARALAAQVRELEAALELLSQRMGVYHDASAAESQARRILRPTGRSRSGAVGRRAVANAGGGGGGGGVAFTAPPTVPEGHEECVYYVPPPPPPPSSPLPSPPAASTAGSTPTAPPVSVPSRSVHRQLSRGHAAPATPAEAMGDVVRVRSRRSPDAPHAHPHAAAFAKSQARPHAAPPSAPATSPPITAASPLPPIHYGEDMVAAGARGGSVPTLVAHASSSSTTRRLRKHAGPLTVELLDAPCNPPQ